MTEFDIYLYGIPVVLALIFLEVAYSTVFGLKLYNFKDTLAGLGLLAGNFFIGLLTKSSIFLLYVYVYQFKSSYVPSRKIYVGCTYESPFK